MSPIPRREFLKTLVATTGVLPLLSGCGGSEGKSTSAASCTVNGIPSATRPDLPASSRKLPTISGTALPRLRGAHLSEYADWLDPNYTGWVQLPEFSAWGGNVIRLFLCPFDQKGTSYEAGKPLKDRLMASLATRQPIIDWCLANDVHVLLCFSTFLLWPVVRNWPEDDGRSLWTDAGAQQELAETWAAMAKKFKGVPGIIFEILNEPQSHTPSSPWVDEPLPSGILNTLYPAVVSAIRAIDTERWISIAPEWNDASNINALIPIKDSRLLYAVHFYGPSSFTHQGIFDPSTAGKISYPSSAWNKASLQTQLQAARDYQLAHGVRVIMSEFGCSRTAPAASRKAWATDVYSILETWGWDSVMFRYEAGMWPDCFRESWALEHSEIEQLCREEFARNLIAA